MANILVVDDSKFMRVTMKNMLEVGSNHKHKVVGEAKSGTDAIQKYKELKPDIVTMDIIMPEELGLDAVKKIVALDPNAKIIMVSAMGQNRVVDEAISLGAKAFIIKPVKPEEILPKIDEVLGS